MSICSYIQMTKNPTFSARRPPMRRLRSAAPRSSGHGRAPAQPDVARRRPGLAETFRMLGDPTRVRILDALAAASSASATSPTLVGISESAVSHQLRLLRGMRLVRRRRAGRLVFYALDDQHIIELCSRRYATSEERVMTATTLPGLRAARRVGLQDRGHGLPRGSGHPRAAAEAAHRARGARRRRPRPAPAASSTTRRS